MLVGGIIKLPCATKLIFEQLSHQKENRSRLGPPSRSTPINYFKVYAEVVMELLYVC